MEQHADLFEDGNVEASIDRKVCSDRGFGVQDGMNVKVEQFLSWAVDTVTSMLKMYISESKSIVDG